LIALEYYAEQIDERVEWILYVSSLPPSHKYLGVCVWAADA
jgi:hypothetical protein